MAPLLDSECVGEPRPGVDAAHKRAFVRKAAQQIQHGDLPNPR